MNRNYNRNNRSNRMEYNAQRDNFDLDYGSDFMKDTDLDFGFGTSDQFGKDYKENEHSGYENTFVFENEDTEPPVQINKIKRPPTPLAAFIILFSSFTVLMSSAIVLSNYGEKWTFCGLIPLVYFGQQFFRYAHPRKRIKTSIILIFFDAAVIGGLYYLRVTFPDHFKLLSQNLLPGIIGTVLITVSIGIIISIAASEIVRNKYCTEPVTAQCTRIIKKYTKHRPGGKHSRSYTTVTYHPVYKFSFVGEEYEVVGEELRKGEDKQLLNHYFQLLIDPEMPEHYIEGRNRAGNFDDAAGVVLFVLFILGIGIFLVYIASTPGCIADKTSADPKKLFF